MENLAVFISFLLNVTGGFIVLAIIFLIVLTIGIYTFKTARLLIALLNYAVTEPEKKIVSNVQKLNKRMNKKETKLKH